MASAEETRAYFDERADELRRSNLVDKWVAVSALFDGMEPGRIIECGAGTGLYTLPMLASGHHVSAVDLSSSSLSQLTSTATTAGLQGALNCVTGDFLEVADDLEPADAVTFIKVLHHMEDRSTISQALQLAWSKIRPGGRLVIFEPNGLSPMWPVLFRIRGKEEWAAERNTLLIRQRFLAGVLGRLPEVTVTAGYRYLVPGTFALRSPLLDRIDRRLVVTPGVRAVSGNLWLMAVRERS